MTYQFSEEMYQFIRNNPDRVNWQQFAEGREDFPDYHCIANPRLIKFSKEHEFWQKYFNNYFGKNCTFPYIVRLINSLLITGQNPIEN